MSSGYSRSLAGDSESVRGSFTKGSDEIIDFTCEPCEERNNTLVEASFYCSVCHAFCCQSCNDFHKSFKANKNHQVYGRGEVDKWGQQTRIEMLPTEICPEPPEEPLKILCLDHKTLGCSACVSLNHRACTHIEYEIKADTSTSQLQPPIIPPLPLLQDTSTSQLQPPIIPPLPLLQDTSTSQLQPPIIPPLPLLQDTRTSQLQPPIITPLPLLQSPLSSLPPDRAPLTPSAPAEETPMQPYQTDMTTNGRKINVKISSDKKDCIIKGFCQMPNGDILLTDYENNKIKRLNPDYVCTDSLHLPVATPRDICCVNYTTAVVTCKFRTLNFLAIITNQMTVTGSQKVNHQCYGIAHHNGQLFVTDMDTSVYIYDTSGHCLRHITPTDNNGKHQLSHTNHIAVSHDGTKIYVCCNKGLVTLDIHGNHLSSYRDKILKNARGVCVDSRGRVILCGYMSQNILELDEGGGTLLREQGTKHYPRSCCIDRYTTSLIVSMETISLSYNYIIRYDFK